MKPYGSGSSQPVPRTCQSPISGPIVQAEGLKVAESLNITILKASSGWLDSFKSHYNIVRNQVCGAAKDTDQAVVSDWQEKLVSLIEGYDLLQSTTK